MTEEEKKAKLEELRERLKAKKASQADQDKEDAKRNEVMIYPSSAELYVFGLSSNSLIENTTKVYKGDSGSKGGVGTQGADQGGYAEAQGEA